MESCSRASCIKSHLSALSTAVPIWHGGNRIHSEFSCVCSTAEFSPGVSTTSVWHVLQIEGKDLATRCPSPWGNSVSVPLTRCYQTVHVPLLPFPVKAESSKAQWYGTHEASPAVVSHYQTKYTQHDGGAGAHCCKMLQALVTLEVPAMFSLNQFTASALECQNTHSRVVPYQLLPGRKGHCSLQAGSQLQVWNLSALLHAKVRWAAAGHKPGIPSASQPHFDLS